jgi:crossover junction endodeoxyribonuclease RusA
MNPATRKWVIQFPPGTPLLTANARLHWAARNERTQALRDAAATLARAQRIPELAAADIVVEYEPPPSRKASRHPVHSQRVTDSDALWPTQKAALDGLTDAGVFSDDRRERVRRVTCAVCRQTHPQGLLRVLITEIGEEKR